jgi:hypothetical protein
LAICILHCWFLVHLRCSSVPLSIWMVLPI